MLTERALSWWDRCVGTALIYLLVVVAVAAAVFGLAAAVFGRGEELALTSARSDAHAAAGGRDRG